MKLAIENVEKKFDEFIAVDNLSTVCISHRKNYIIF